MIQARRRKGRNNPEPGPRRSALDERLKSVTTALAGYGLIARKASYGNLRPVLQMASPLPWFARPERRITFSSYIERFFPWAGRYFYHLGGEAIGPYLGTIVGTHQPFFLQPQPAPHVGAIGSTRYGKTMAVAVIGLQLADLHGMGQFYIDTGGDLARYLRGKGAIVLTLKPTGDPEEVVVTLNILDSHGGPYNEWVPFIHSLLCSVLEVDSGNQRQALWEGLVATYGQAGIRMHESDTWARRPPVASNLHATIVGKRRDAQNQGDVVQRAVWETLEQKTRMITRDGPYGYFDGPSSFRTEYLENRIVVFDLKPLRSEFPQVLAGLVLLSYAKFQFGKMKRGWVIGLEEIWKFLKRGRGDIGAALLNELESAVREGAKAKCTVVFITQNLSDLSEEGKEFLGNCDTWLLFNLKPSEANLARKVLWIPDYYLEQLPKLPVGHALVWQTSLPNWVRVQVDAAEILEEPEEAEAEPRPPVTNPPAEASPRLDEAWERVRAQGIVELSALGLTSREKGKLLRRYPAKQITVAQFLGGKAVYLYHDGGLRNPLHEAHVRECVRFLQSRGVTPSADSGEEPGTAPGTYREAKTRGPDVVATMRGLRVAVEIEEGTNKMEDVLEKARTIEARYDRGYLVVDSRKIESYLQAIGPREKVRVVNRAGFVREIGGLVQTQGDQKPPPG